MRTRSRFRPALVCAILFGALLTGCDAPAKAPSLSTKDLGSSQEVAVPVRPDSHFLLTSDNAKATLVLFTDFQCPYCARIDPLIRRAINEYKHRINLVVRNLPLSMHRNATPSAQAVEAAAAQGQLSEMMELLLTNQAEWSNALDPRPIFVEYALRLGLDVTKFEAVYSSTEVHERISRDHSDAVALGLKGTPSLVLNGKVLPVDSSTYDTIKLPLDAVLVP